MGNIPGSLVLKLFFLSVTLSVPRYVNFQEYRYRVFKYPDPT